LSQTLEALPDPESLLALNLQRFASTETPDNSTSLLTDANFWELKGDIVRDRGSIGLWLYPAAVCTIPLVLMQ
jgi:hypothetical protein